MTVLKCIGAAILLVLMVLYIAWRRRSNCRRVICKKPDEAGESQLVYGAGPQVQEKDSLDEHLDTLTRKLAEKEGRMRVSKSKIQRTQYEINNLQAIDNAVRDNYRQIMESLRSDFLSNEQECLRLQEQIEWVSRRRAELKEEVRLGQRMYGEAAAELAYNLKELQKGREREREHIATVTDKPLQQLSSASLRHRKEPQLPRGEFGSLVIKTPPASPPPGEVPSWVLGHSNPLTADGEA